MTTLETVAHHIFDMDPGTLSDTERTEARRCLLDTLGCAIAGSKTNAAQILYETAQTRSLLPQASVVGYSDLCSLEEAVLSNSTSARVLDFNDTYSGRNKPHASETVIPLVLAVAELRKKSGRQILSEIALGYDLTIRISEAIAPLLPKGWAPNATVGQIAAPGLAAWLLGLNERQIAHAMAINVISNATLAAVFKDGLSMAKSMASALVVQRGIQAARLAACGATGPLRVIEGKAGFVEMVAGEFDARALAREFPEPPISKIWLKAYPTMFHFHSSIEAALQLHGRTVDESRIARVEVRVAPAVAKVAATPEHWSVDGHEDAQFSLPYSVAVALRHGSCKPDHFTEDSIRDAGTRELMKKMSVTPDESLDAGSHPQPTHIQVVFEDGSELETTVRFPKGHAENRLSDDELRGKFRLLVEPVRGTAGASEVLGAVSGLESSEDPSSLFALLRGERQ